MKGKTLITGLCISICLMTGIPAFTQRVAPTNPMSQGSWILGVGIGPGIPVFGNGYGFGPGFKVYFENGTWQLGPGVLSLGGDVGFSFFSESFLDGGRETWLNFMFGARSAYHYGWDVPGLDTYGGIPLGIGFSAYSHNNIEGYRGAQNIFPYVGFFLGASYFFNHQVGLNGEVGYNVTYANIGVIFKLD
jgi:hypothetical protein